MKLESLAHIAEIVGGVAVLVSLVFVILEVRENTEAVRAATYQEVTAQSVELMLQVSSDLELAATVRKVVEEGPVSLSADEAYRYFFWSRSNWRVFENVFFQYRRGVLGEEEWETIKKQICSSFRPERGAYFDRAHRNNLDDDFLKLVDRCPK